MKVSDVQFDLKTVGQIVVLVAIAVGWYYSHNQTIDNLKKGNETTNKVYEEQQVQQEQMEDITQRQELVQKTVEELYPKVDAAFGIVKGHFELDEYRVVEGDSWWEIAEKLGVNPDNLKLYNEHISNINQLEAGMIIFYPKKGSVKPPGAAEGPSFR